MLFERTGRHLIDTEYSGFRCLVIRKLAFTVEGDCISGPPREFVVFPFRIKLQLILSVSNAAP
jgi:hypothetical protein